MATVTTVPVRVSTVLQDLKVSVNKFLNDEIEAKKPGMNPSIELAMDVDLAIENANYAWGYSGALTSEVEKADAAVKELLGKLKGLVNDLQAKHAVASKNLQSRTADFINSLPLTSWHPKVTGLCPRYVFIANQGFKVSFTGNFRYASNNGGHSLTVTQSVPAGEVKQGDTEVSTEAKVELKGKPLKATERTLEFEVTGLAKENTSIYQCQYMQGTLKVPYTGGVLKTVTVGMLQSVQYATYNFLVAGFPLSPGKITLTYPKSAVTGVVQRHFRSMTLMIHRKDFPEGEALERCAVIKTTDANWRITSRPQLVCGNTRTDIDESQYGPDFVNVKLAIPEKSDHIKAHVEFDETKDVVEEKDQTESVNLKWGESFTFTAPRFNVDFESFDGQKFEYKEPIHTNPYLHVVKTGNDTYQLQAVIPH